MWTKESTAKSVSTESNSSSVTLQGQIACFAESKLSLVVAGQSAVLQIPCERRLVLLELLLSRCRLTRRLIEAKFNPAPALCSSWAKPHPHWLEKKIIPSSLTESQLAILRIQLTPYRSRATVVAFWVRPTSYRPRATVATMNHIVAVAWAAKVEFPFSISRR